MIPLRTLRLGRRASVIVAVVASVAAAGWLGATVAGVRRPRVVCRENRPAAEVRAIGAAAGAAWRRVRWKNEARPALMQGRFAAAAAAMLAMPPFGKGVLLTIEDAPPGLGPPGGLGSDRVLVTGRSPRGDVCALLLRKVGGRWISGDLAE